MRVLVFALGLVLAACTSATCTRGGRTVQAGDRFYDGCNACECGANGSVTCTARACLDGGTPNVFCLGGGGENRAPHEEWIENGQTCFCTTAGDVLCGAGELAGSCERGGSRFENGFSDTSSCACTCNDGTFMCPSCDAGP